MACLARWVLDTHATAEARREWLNRFQRRHGQAVADGLRERVRAEWERRREA